MNAIVGVGPPKCASLARITQRLNGLEGCGMQKITIIGQAALAAGALAAALSITSAGMASAQPTPAPGDVCFNGPYPIPTPPPPWGPGTIEGCINPDSWFNQWGWRHADSNWRDDAGQPAPEAPGWKYVGPGCEYTSNQNWRYTGPECQRETPPSTAQPVSP